MKKIFFTLLMVVFLIGSFLGGAWYVQTQSSKEKHVEGERRILHYVDPMNPAHTSNEPGIAPCGMPMEPVYDESIGLGGSGAATSAGPGSVFISAQKQQLIGVTVAPVQIASTIRGIRTLGRVAADEDRVFSLVAATNGWMEDFQGSTTGSKVSKNQLLAQIKVYNYDFFSWQQRYLAELSYMGRRRRPVTNFSSARQPLASPEQSPGPLSPESQAETGQAAAMQPHDMTQAAKQHDAEAPATEKAPPAGADHSTHQPPSSPSDSAPQEGESAAPKQHTIQSFKEFFAKKMEKEVQVRSLDPMRMSEDDILYANKARLELSALGAQEAQLAELAQTGRYMTAIQLRSPVDGLVISRTVFPNQRVESGAECFKVADLSKVWVLADVFAGEAEYIKPGMKARVSLPQQSKSFEATVSDILPPFDAAARTLKVRLEASNPDYLLRPDMFVDVEFFAPLPPAITVPAEAVLDSGLRTTVFVALGDGVFEPRPVATGWRFDGNVQILEGLNPGENIVTSGNFLLDSESRMRLAAAGLHGLPEKDPVCGREVYPSKAKAAGLTLDRDGKAYYFCSEECMGRFNKAPASPPQSPAIKADQLSVGDPQKVLTPNDMVIDLVCDMPVDAGKSRAAGLISEYQGKTYFFCTEECKKQFDHSPASYLHKGAANKPQHAAPGYGVHGHD